MPKHYKTILLDPPWPESGGGRIKRGADRHYKLLPVRRMPEVIIGSGVFMPADDSHMYMWSTNNYVPEALWLIEQLGFNYKTMLTWSKIGRPGIGQYFRGRTEQLLFAVRGNGKRLRDGWTPRRDLSTLIEAPRVTDAHGKSIHSAKPIEAYRLIEAASPPPRLEMFARGRRRGWTPWGNEI